MKRRTTNAPATAVGRLLAAQHLTLSVCESCTAGALGAAITQVPGSSQYFLGGVIAYADAIKTSVVGVAPSLLRRSGAVSAAAARAMALGVRRLVGSDTAVAITGIAGPAGGSRRKPVGTAYIAVAVRKRITVRHYAFRGGRQTIRKSAVRAALVLLRQMLRER